MRRRAFVLGSLLLTVGAACKKEERCKNCGMKIDPASPWNADLVAADGATVRFDTPRCAFTYWRGGKMQAKDIRAQDYYDRKWRDGAELRFVAGGDVLGPMGPDLVPVDAPRAGKFLQDHTADRVVTVSEVTLELLNSLK